MTNDMFCIDLKTGVLSKPLMTKDKMPRVRMKHASGVVGKKMVVTGGISKQRKTIQDLWLFSLGRCLVTGRQTPVGSAGHRDAEESRGGEQHLDAAWTQHGYGSEDGTSREDIEHCRD
jgi:hypothetical protein